MGVFQRLVVLVVVLLCGWRSHTPSVVNAFLISTSISSTSASFPSTTTQLFFFGGPKDDGSPGDYVCKDCGYVFTKGPAAWAALPDNYSCPPCGSLKRRFTKVPKGSAGTKPTAGSKNKTNDPPPKKSWF